MQLDYNPEHGDVYIVVCLPCDYRFIPELVLYNRDAEIEKPEKCAFCDNDGRGVTIIDLESLIEDEKEDALYCKQAREIPCGAYIEELDELRRAIKVDAVLTDRQAEIFTSLVLKQSPCNFCLNICGCFDGNCGYCVMACLCKGEKLAREYSAAIVETLTDEQLENVLDKLGKDDATAHEAEYLCHLQVMLDAFRRVFKRDCEIRLNDFGGLSDDMEMTQTCFGLAWRNNFYTDEE